MIPRRGRALSTRLPRVSHDLSGWRRYHPVTPSAKTEWAGIKTGGRDVGFAEQYGPWAVIAGGSEGTGESFAVRLAAQGVNLVLVARKPAPLEALAERLRKSSKVQVRTLAQDL